MSVFQSLLTPVKRAYFILSEQAVTSAGVYNGDILVRTLWGNQLKGAGVHPIQWDGKDDAGVELADADYTIKILKNNVAYEWEGVIGNTSESFTGSGVHTNLYLISDMVVIGDYAYYAVGYNEGKESHRKFLLTNPQEQIILPAEDENGLHCHHICTDGTIIYWAGLSGIGSVTASIVGTNVSDDQITTFSSGTPQVIFDITYSALNIENNEITGLAVQPTSTYLFCSHEGTDEIRVFNKTTGALVRSIAFTNPKRLTCDAGNNLWVISGTAVEKYPVNGDGTLGTLALSLSGLVDPRCMAISPAGTEIAVVDSGTKQQVRLFNASGVEGTPLGQLGGYATSPDVANDKFYFDQTQEFDLPLRSRPFVAYQPDGKIWVGDNGNNRCQLFSSAKAYLNTIQYIGNHYSVAVDKNDATKIFANFLEFERDYGVTLSPTAGWTFVKNWSYFVTQNTEYGNHHFHRMVSVVTLSNGRTYCFVRVGSNLRLLNLAETGIVYSGTELTGLHYFLDTDGSLWKISASTVGLSLVITRQALTAFDGLYNLTWAVATTIETSPVLITGDPIISSWKAFGRTASGKIITLRGDDVTGYHLGAIENDQWMWKTMPSTHSIANDNEYEGEFPSDHYFDIGHNVQGASAYVKVLEDNIFVNYYGEFWQNSQTNKYYHFHESGLMVSQFGITGPDAVDVGRAPVGMAGNANNASLVKVGDDYYLYHCDESWHGGIHAWKISNLDSIEIINRPFIKVGIPGAPRISYVDLMADLPFHSTLTDGTARWTRDPVADIDDANSEWFVKTNKYTYGKARDVSMEHLQKVAGTYARWIKIDLGANVGLTSWSIEGGLMFPLTTENEGTYLEILDDADRVIVEIKKYIPVSGTTAIDVNDVTIIEGDKDDVFKQTRKLRALSISAVAGNMTVEYAIWDAVVVTVFDVLANWQNPTTLKINVNSSAAAGSTRQMAISELKFYSGGEGADTSLTGGVVTVSYLPLVSEKNKPPIIEDVVVTGAGYEVDTPLTATVTGEVVGPFAIGTHEFQWYTVTTVHNPTLTAISGATSASYTPVAGDITKRLVVKARFVQVGGQNNMSPWLYSLLTPAIVA